MTTHHAILPADGPIPPGYVVLGQLAFHIAHLAEHSTDVHRFQRCYPTAAKIMEAGGDLQAVYELVSDLPQAEFDAVQLTLDEFTAMAARSAESLNQQINEHGATP